LGALSFEKERASIASLSEWGKDNRWGQSKQVFTPPQSPTKQSGPTDPGASALGRGGSTLARTDKNSAQLAF
jgi:hypothetical protein